MTLLCTLLGCFASRADAAVVKDIVPAGMTPADRSTVESFQTVVFTFDEAVYFNPDILCPVISKKGLLESPAATWSLSDDHKTLTWTMAEAMDDAGTYYLGIIEDSLVDQAWLDSEGQTGRACDQIECYFFIEQKIEPLTYDFAPSAVSPADGSQVESLGTIAMLFPYDDIKYEWGEAKAYLKDASGNVLKTITYFNIYNDYEGDGTYLEINAGITAPGTYTLNIPAGSFGSQDWLDCGFVGYSCNPELNYSWTIKEVTESAMTYTVSARYTGDDGSYLATSSTFNLLIGSTFKFSVDDAQLDDNWELTVKANGETLEPGADGYAYEVTPKAAEIEIEHTFSVVVEATVESGMTPAMVLNDKVGVKVNANGMIDVDGLSDGDTVTVYALNGVCLLAETARGEGRLNLTVDAPANAAYIVAIASGEARTAVKVVL